VDVQPVEVQQPVEYWNKILHFQKRVINATKKMCFEIRRRGSPTFQCSIQQDLGHYKRLETVTIKFSDHGKIDYTCLGALC
jgi:hypothetical protein